ncbi:hypothetical protein [Alkalispirochaeta alkalica]|uniref:hypothetical protein n=1 Tax=Alkalispirochaeta alkalica TaxID=46356 RepID=UPI00035FE285|nr:hypothetical protein [Alkalispirochaeta alkalica]
MKLTIIAILLPFLTPALLQGGTPAPRDPRWEPRGPVVEVREYLLGEEEDQEELVHRYRFDHQGKLTELVRHIPDPDAPVTQHFSYNDQGMLEHWLARDPSGQIIWGYRYRYDQEGTLLQETEYGPGETITGQRAFTSRQEGDTVRVEESAYDSSGEVLWWMQRLRTSETPGEDWSLYYPDGRIITEGSRLYDSQGRIIREEERDTAARTTTITTYRYNQGENPLRIEETDSDGTLLRREEFQYDQFGNPLLHRTDIPADTVHTARYYQYEYDDHGNWTTRTIWNVRTRGDQLTAVTRERRFRHFTYHKTHQGEE